MAFLSSRSRAVVFALGIFVLGIACGIIVDRWMLQYRRPWARMMAGRPPAGPHKDRILNRYTRELGLDDEQRDQVGAILEQSREAMHAVRRGVRQDLADALEGTRLQIREILTPEQVEKFDEMSKRMDERWKKRRKGRQSRPW